MPIPVQCAGCAVKLNAPDAAAGKRLKCPKCGQPVPVPLPAPPPDPVPEPVDLDAAPPVRPSPKAAEDDRPAPPRKKRAAEPEDRDGRLPRGEREERDRDAAAKPKAGAMTWIAGILGGLLMLGGVGVAGWGLVKEDDPRQAGGPMRPRPNPGPFNPGPGPFNPGPGPINPNPKVEPEEEYKPVPLTPTDLTPYGFPATIDLPAGATVKRGEYQQIELPGGKKLRIEVQTGPPQADYFDQNMAKATVVEKTDTAVLAEEKNGALSSSWYLKTTVTAGDRRFVIKENQIFGKKAAFMPIWAVAKTLRQTDAQKSAEKARSAAMAKLTAAGHRMSLGELILHNPDAAAATALADLYDLTELSVSADEKPIPPQVWTAAAALPNLRRIRARCDDTALAPLAKSKALATLDLSNAPITDAGLADLAPLTGLTGLTLSYCRIDGSGLAVLAKLPKVEYLSLDGIPLADASLRHLSGLPELKTLVLSASPVSDAGVAHLTGLPKLTALILRGTAVTGSGLSALASSPNLDALVLSHSAATDAGLAKVAGVSAKRVDLTATRVGDAGVAAVAKWNGLRELNLSDTGATDTGMAALAAAKLTHLDLSRSTVTDTGVAALGAAADLEHLGLDECPVTGAVVATAVKFPKLQRLVLSWTDVTDAALAPLAALPKERRLSFDATNTRVTPAAAKAATRNSVFVTASEPPKAPPVGKAASIDPPTPLDKLKPADPEKLFKALKADPDRDEDAPGKPVTGVFLSRDNPPLTDLELAEIRDLKTLKYLGVSSDKITDGGLAYLSGLSGLESLSLSTGGVTGSGFVHLQKLTKLKQLNLPSFQDYRPYTAADLRPLEALAALEEVSVPQIDSVRTLFAFYGRLPKLKKVSVYERVRSADLKNLPPLPSVQEVHLSARRESDTLRGPDTVGLANLKAAVVVDIAYGIDDVAAANLAKVKTIRELTVNGRLMTEAGYKSLAGLPELTRLRFSGGHFDAAALKAVATAPKLAELMLNVGTLTDPTLAGLTGAQELLVLRLNGQAVTDAVIPTLAKLPKLDLVDLSQTAVSKAGVEKLRKAKPELDIQAPRERD